MKLFRRSLLVVAGAILLAAVATSPLRATEAAWARAAGGGLTLVMRHAPAVSTSDPAGFDIEDCSTQSPLSDEGRTQARRESARFAVRNVSIAAVYTSRYCRAIEHGELTFSSEEVQPVPELDRLAGEGPERDAQIAEMIARINGFTGPGNQVFITHAENVEALTGTPGRDGEVILMRPAEEADGMPTVVGRILLN